MRFPGNCVVVALLACALHPLTTRLLVIRNPSRRWHLCWQRGGKRYEFYTPGASRCGYLRNAVRMGRVRAIGEDG